MPVCSTVGEDRVPGRVKPVFSVFTWTGRAEPFGGELSPFYLTVDNVPEAYEDVEITLTADADIGDIRKGLSLAVGGGLEDISLGEHFVWGSDSHNAHGCDAPGWPPDSYDVASFKIVAEHPFNAVILQASPVPGRITFVIYPIGNPSQAACGGNPWVDITMEFVYKSGETIEPIDLKMWGEDWCQNAVFVPSLRPTNHLGLPPGGIFTTEANRFDLISAHTGRWTTGRNPPSTFDEEVCNYSYATVVIDEQNYGHALFCSNQYGGLETHKAFPFIHQPDDGLSEEERLSDVIPKGYGGYIGAYRAPGWSEVMLHSFQQLCEPPLR